MTPTGNNDPNPECRYTRKTTTTTTTTTICPQKNGIQKGSITV